MTIDPVAVAAHFATRYPPVESTPVRHGHIHDTSIVRCAGPATDANAVERIVLQRLNRSVFHDLDGLATNLARVSAHLRTAAAARGERSIVADPIPTRAGGWMFVDDTGASWRATAFVEGTRVLGSTASPGELRAAARAFARLTGALDDVGPLVETIPRFHDLARRRTSLAHAVSADRAGRVAGVRDLVDAADDLGDRVERQLAAARADLLPRRVMHNDAKVDNVLVDAATGTVACIVDLDTVMAGTVLNDFGELTRTAATRAAEDEPDLTKLILDRARFAALAEGYLAGSRAWMLESERECLALAGPLLTLENAVRFLTDHLDGDVYFRVHHAGRNATRARAQLHWAGLLLDRIAELRQIITAATRAS
ncbi:MAG TPA: aminoglycoside phosphotransferase family protein [Acidimicrobiia bacterium]